MRGRPPTRAGTVCQVCGGTVQAKGLCMAHYQQQRRASGILCCFPKCGRKAEYKAAQMCNKHYLQSKTLLPCYDGAAHSWTPARRCRVCGVQRPPMAKTLRVTAAPP